MYVLTQRHPDDPDLFVVAAPLLERRPRRSVVDPAQEEFVHIEQHQLGIKRPRSNSAPKRSRASRIGWALVTLAVVVVWARAFAPQALGGPAGYVMVRGVSMLPTFEPGDLVITHPQASYGKGDVVAHRVPQGDIGEGIIVIHRITGGSARDGFVLQGDNNNDPDGWRPKPKDIIGEAWLRVPKMGLVLGFLHAPVPLAGLAAGLTVALILVPKRKPDEASTG